MIEKKLPIAAAVAAVTLIGILGFTSPREGMAEARTEIRALSKRVDGHDIQFAETRKDIGYIMDGIDDLRGLGPLERARRRRHTRSGE